MDPVPVKRETAPLQPSSDPQPTLHSAQQLPTAQEQEPIDTSFLSSALESQSQPRQPAAYVPYREKEFPSFHPAEIILGTTASTELPPSSASSHSAIPPGSGSGSGFASAQSPTRTQHPTPAIFNHTSSFTPPLSSLPASNSSSFLFRVKPSHIFLLWTLISGVQVSATFHFDQLTLVQFRLWRDQAYIMIRSENNPQLSVRPAPESSFRRATDLDFFGAGAGAGGSAREEYTAGSISPWTELGLSDSWLLRFSLSPAKLDQMRHSALRLVPAAIMRWIPDESSPPPILKAFRCTQPDVMPALSFKPRFMLESLLMRRIVRMDDVPQLVGALSGMKDSRRVRVLSSLRNSNDVQAALQSRIRIMCPLQTEKSHTALIASVTVTPTRVIPTPYIPMSTNAILRHFSAHHDKFLKVSYVDDTLSRIPNGSQEHAAEIASRQTGVYGRYRRLLTSGIQVAGQTFVFLACSESQLKTQTAWFVAEDEGLGFTVETVRAFMGVISDKVPNKYSARMGLSFSSTRPYGPVQKITQIPDKFSSAGHIFTDGAGICHPSLAMKSGRILNRRRAQNVAALRPVSAVQVRVAGHKGIIVAWPSRCSKNELLLRPSMKKLEPHPHNALSLNICNVSSFQPVYLNRQVILVLLSLGVKNKRFLQLFDEQVATAKSFSLTGRITADKQSMYNMTRFPLRSALAHGMSQEPLLRSIAQLLQARRLLDLKHRARIRMPMGANLIGVPDESGVLQEGEVFCQYSNPSMDGTVVLLEGECVVYRSPALHPGDVQTVQAVDNMALRHLVDVVVISVKGERDMPSMLAGGDLDGDMFCIYQDEELTPQQCVEASSYTRRDNPYIVDKVEEKHIREAIVQFALNDVLGNVGKAHVAIADRLGADSEPAIHMAEIHSDAVDFSKTGIAASYPNELRPQQWPDYMERKSQRVEVYESPTVLGLMYRKINDWLPGGQPLGYSDPRFNLRVPVRYVAKAKELKKSYDEDLSILLHKYGISEAEAVAGVVLPKSDSINSTDKSMKEPVEDIYADMFELYLVQAEQWVAANPNTSLLSPANSLQLFAVAAYQITAELGNPHRVPQQDDKEIPMISFPWVYADVLTGLAHKLDHAIIIDSDGENILNQSPSLRKARVVKSGSLHESNAILIVDSDEENPPLNSRAQKRRKREAEFEAQEAQTRILDRLREAPLVDAVLTPPLSPPEPSTSNIIPNSLGDASGTASAQSTHILTADEEVAGDHPMDSDNEILRDEPPLFRRASSTPHPADALPNNDDVMIAEPSDDSNEVEAIMLNGDQQWPVHLIHDGAEAQPQSNTSNDVDNEEAAEHRSNLIRKFGLTRQVVEPRSFANLHKDWLQDENQPATSQIVEPPTPKRNTIFRSPSPPPQSSRPGLIAKAEPQLQSHPAIQSISDSDSDDSDFELISSTIKPVMVEDQADTFLNGLLTSGELETQRAIWET